MSKWRRPPPPPDLARLVFVTRRPPWPLDNGARIRSFRLAEGLARRFELTLVTFADGPGHEGPAVSAAELERELPGARVEMIPFDGRWPRGARRGALRARSDALGHYATPSLRGAIARLAPGAVLQLEDPGVALAGLGTGALLTTYASHNIEHRIMRDIGRRVPAAHRPFMALEWRKLAREERRVWRGADLCLACSEIDAATMRAGGARRVELCPNGSVAHEPLPLQPLAPGEPLRLLFVGALVFWPYGHGMRWFVNDALPAIRAAAGPVVLDAVGPHDGDLADAPDVTYHGRVPDVQPFYERAHALVIPVFEGSGTRLKVVEAALLNRPIISTGLGAEGLPVSYLRAEDVDGFATAVATLRRELESGDPALAARCEAARESVEGLTWPRISSALADLYEDQITTTR